MMSLFVFMFYPMVWRVLLGIESIIPSQCGIIGILWELVTICVPTQDLGRLPKFDLTQHNALVSLVNL
jgi:hypothetical protein